MAAPLALVEAEGLRVYLTSRVGAPVPCVCGRPLCTPTSATGFTGTLTLDYLLCSRCRAHVILTLTA